MRTKLISFGIIRNTNDINIKIEIYKLLILKYE